MLNLLDRQLVEGLTIYRDDQDVRKFYVLPDTPTITQDAHGRPRFLFIKYVDDRPGVAEADEKNGAYTQLHVTLAVPEDRLARVMTALRERLVEEQRQGAKPFGRAITSTEPLLARPDWVDGSVTLATFATGESGMVRSVAGSKKPDLTGDLGAAFALELDAAATAIFWDAFESGNVPVVVAYELTYKARVPAARMVIHAEREKVRTAVWGHALPFVFDPPRKRYVPLAAQALDPGVMVGLRRTHGALVRALVPRRLVTTAVTNTIDVDISFGEGGGDAAVRERLLEIANEILTANIIPAFFAGNTILGQLTDAAAGEDMLELKDAIEESLEPFHIELTEEVAVDRPSNPSGILQMLLTDEQRRQAFREVPLSDPFFQQLEVTVSTSGVELERDGIDVIHVFLEYDHVDVPTGRRVFHALDDVLRREDAPVTFLVERLARDAGGVAITDYRIRTEIHYRIDLPKSVGSWTEQHHRQVIVAPRALGALRVGLVLTARPESIESAKVELAYRTRAGQLLSHTVTLTPADPRQSWFQFTGEVDEGREEPTYQYRVTWTLPGGAEIADAPRSSNREVLEIGSPFTTPIELTIRPEGNLTGITEIAGELRYHDVAHRYQVVRSFSLTAATSKEHVVIHTLPGGPRTAELGGRVRYADGTHADLPVRTVEAGTVWLGVALQNWLEVYIQPFEVDWQADVRVATVMITYAHADGRIERSGPINFMRGGPVPVDATKEWKVALSAGDPPTFDYSVRYIGFDGRSNDVSFHAVSDGMIWLKRPPAQG